MSAVGVTLIELLDFKVSKLADLKLSDFRNCSKMSAVGVTLIEYNIPSQDFPEQSV